MDTGPSDIKPIFEKIFLKKSIQIFYQKILIKSRTAESLEKNAKQTETQLKQHSEKNNNKISDYNLKKNNTS